MALKLNQCIFDILTKLGTAALNSLISFLQAKINLLKNEINKLFAIVDLIDSTLEDLSTAIGDIANILSGKQIISNLIEIAKNIAPSCGETAMVFQGAPPEIVQKTATFAENKLYEARQLLATKSGIKETQRMLSDQADALSGLTSVIQQFAQKKIVNYSNMLKGVVDSVTEEISSGFNEVQDEVEKFNNILPR